MNIFLPVCLSICIPYTHTYTYAHTFVSIHTYAHTYIRALCRGDANSCPHLLPRKVPGTWFPWLIQPQTPLPAFLPHLHIISRYLCNVCVCACVCVRIRVRLLEALPWNVNTHTHTHTSFLIYGKRLAVTAPLLIGLPWTQKGKPDHYRNMHLRNGEDKHETSGAKLFWFCATNIVTSGVLTLWVTRTKSPQPAISTRITIKSGGRKLGLSEDPSSPGRVEQSQ